MGGPGGYDQREPVESKSFQAMMSDARGEYANRSASSGGGKGGATGGFKSAAPRLQSATSSSAHTQKQFNSPGPGAYSSGKGGGQSNPILIE